MTHALDYFFETYHFSAKNRFETMQIFDLLSEEKQKNFVANFREFAMSVKKLERDIAEEQELLIGSAVEKVKDALLKNRKEKINKEIQAGLAHIKTQL